MLSKQHTQTKGEEEPTKNGVGGIGVGRFRILGGGGGGGKGGANSQQAHDVVMTSMRRLSSHRRHFDVMCPLGF